MIAVGDHYLTDMPEVLIRASCPFGGGVGGCYEELCGVLSGAIILLGALWGRVSPAENDDLVRDLACGFRQQFIEANGSSQCRAIRDTLPDQDKRCLPVVREATRALVELIEEASREHPPERSRWGQTANDNQGGRSGGLVPRKAGTNE